MGYATPVLLMWTYLYILSLSCASASYREYARNDILSIFKTFALTNVLSCHAR